MSTRTKCGRCKENETGICKTKRRYKEYYEGNGKKYNNHIYILPFVKHDCEYFVDKRSKIQ